MAVTFPGESRAYREARDRLLALEAGLRRATEEVAAARRALPPGGAVPEDYAFAEATPAGTGGGVVPLSSLLARPGDVLIAYSMMFPRHPADERAGPAGGRTAALPLHGGPCPSCTALLDQLDGAVAHLPPHVAFAVVAKAPPEHLRDFAQDRGWRHLRLLSSGRTTYNRDYHGESGDGAQMPMLNVFRRDDEGLVRHAWGAELLYAPAPPGQDPRHVGTLEPLWNLLDLTPAGRGADWEEQLSYPCCSK